MNCAKCERQAAGNTEYCEVCLVATVERRVKAEFARLKIAHGARIVAVSNATCQGAVNGYMAAKLRIPVTTEGAEQECCDMALLPISANMLAERFLSSMFGNPQAAGLSILKSCLDTEIEEYARIKRLKYAKPKAGKTSKFIEGLETRSKGTTFALAKIAQELEWQ